MLGLVVFRVRDVELRARGVVVDALARPKVHEHAVRRVGHGTHAAWAHDDAAVALSDRVVADARDDAHALSELEETMLAIRNNLANSYAIVGRGKEALRLRRDVYYGQLKLKNNVETLRAANNYALSLIDLKHSEEAKPLLRQTIPIARRVLGNNDETRLRMGWYYAAALYLDAGATLDELREAVTTLEDVERIARRVFGGAHPIVMGVEDDLQDARATRDALQK